MRNGRVSPRHPLGRAKRKTFQPQVEGVERRVLLTHFVVTSTSDTPTPGYLTLREAITQANAHPGPDTIGFQFPAQVISGISNYDPNYQVWRIQPTQALPAITDTLTIDGYSQNIRNANPANEVQAISITGSPFVGSTFTLTFGGQMTVPIPFDAAPSVIQGALEALPNIGAGNVSVSGQLLGVGQEVSVTFQKALGDMNVSTISASTADPGVQMHVVTTTQGAPAQVLSTPNTLSTGADAHIRVILDGSLTSGATGLTIASSHNIIRGLIIDGFQNGIWIKGPSAVGNLIQGNTIGRYVLYPNPLLQSSNVSVLSGSGNSGVGVLIESPSNNTVGGTLPEALNTIAGNGLQGVRIAPGAFGNQVLGNLIGVAAQDGIFYYIAGNGLEGVLVQAASNFIGSYVTGARNVISGNGTKSGGFQTGSGVHLQGPGAYLNTVQGNDIGTDIGGTFLFGQGNPGNVADGVFLDDAPRNTIGGNATGARNVISGNFGNGVRIAGPSATGNLIQGNYIGTKADGSGVLPNALDGVWIASANNIVGGTGDNEKNVISGNLRGVLITGASATGNQVLGNFIGTDPAGTSDFGNSQEGVRIENATDNTVGGSSTAARNLISGNNVGVTILGGSATRNVLLGNFLGTDVTGTLPLNNALEGVRIENAPGNTIGGSSAGDQNLISSNHWGVVITGPSATEDLVQGNLIGTDVSGTSPLGNELDGVLVTNGAAINRIGGSDPAAGNTIGYNKRDGVRVETNSSIDNAILSNRIFSNGELGINLAVPSDPPSGVTPNDPGDGDIGPNNLQNAPILTLAKTFSSSTTIQGGLASTPNTTFTIQFFATSSDPAQNGRYLGQTTASTDGGGNATFSASVATVLSMGQSVRATATDPNGNTSEFSPDLAVIVGNAVQFSMANYTVSETAGTATITVVRGDASGQVTVNYATGGGSAVAGVNYTSVSGTLTFQPGQTTQSFIIPILFTPQHEGDVTVNLTLSNPSEGEILGSPSSAVLTILDAAGNVTAPTGPQVVGVQAIPNRRGIAGIVVTFSEPLDAGRAQNLINYGYSVRIGGRDHRIGTQDDKLVGIQQALYDPATLTVTLILETPVHPNMPIQVTINQGTDVPSAGVGVSNLAGNLLDGSGNGQPGGVFTTIVGGGPTVAARAPSSQIRPANWRAWANRPQFTNRGILPRPPLWPRLRRGPGYSRLR